MAVQQHKIAYVTGSSRGIGKALVELLIQSDYKVIGIARTNDFDSPNYRFDELDLSDLNAVSKYDFDKSGDEVLLVNNAGYIGEIEAVGNVSNDSILNVMNINTLAPQILSNNFIKKFAGKEGKFHILNISSGAGKKPITSWATYCASKAAIDLYSETIAEELEWKQLDNWSIHSCAPGVVDTKMQEEIRSSSAAEFQHVQNFVDYHEKGDLFSPQYVADKLLYLIQNPRQFKDVLVSVRDF